MYSSSPFHNYLSNTPDAAHVVVENDYQRPIFSRSNTAEDLAASPAAMFLSAFSSPTPTAPPDDEGQTISGYTLGPVVGYGGTSIIRRASSSSGNISAVKIIKRSELVKAGNAPRARRRLQHEAAVWATLTHEHILPLFSALHTPYADYFFTLYCPAGSLFDILRRDGTPALLQDDAGMMFRQVVRGLRYLHEVARYVHRDMKLENVLVDEMGVCKIGDFGMSRKIDAGPSTGDSDGEDMLDDEQSLDATIGSDVFSSAFSNIHRASSMTAPSKRQPRNTINLPHALARFNTVRHRNSTSTNQPVISFQPGSLPYAAPELLLPHTSETMRPHPCQDIWSLGVMLYALLTGKLPFMDSFEPRLQMKILSGIYECPRDIGRGAEHILQGCLDRNISTRWTIAMVDDVAWGVGWGAEGDDATPLDHPADHPSAAQPSSPSTGTSSPTKQASSPTSRSPSRSRRSRPPPLDTIDSWQYAHRDEPQSRASIDSASRRSTSRAKRSLSRAPVLTDQSTSAHRRRSMSRQGHAESPKSTSTHVMSPTAISPTLSASSSSGLPPSFVERGRRRRDYEYAPHQPHSHRPSSKSKTPSSHSTSVSASNSRSRSASPGMVPTTPQDAVIPLPGTSSSGSHGSAGSALRDALLEHPDELRLDGVGAGPHSSSGGLSLAGMDDVHEVDELRGRSSLRGALPLPLSLSSGVPILAHEGPHVRVASGKDSAERTRGGRGGRSALAGAHGGIVEDEGVHELVRRRWADEVHEVDGGSDDEIGMGMVGELGMESVVSTKHQHQHRAARPSSCSPAVPLSSRTQMVVNVNVKEAPAEMVERQTASLSGSLSAAACSGSAFLLDPMALGLGQPSPLLTPRSRSADHPL